MASINLQDLRRRLYVKAKAEKTWRSWGLYVHVAKLETLRAAYEVAKRNDGAPGIDGVTFEAIEAAGVERFLAELRDELVSRTYRPLRNRRVEIPKDGGKVRVLGVPTVTANCGTVQYAFGVRRCDASLPSLGRPAATDSLRASSIRWRMGASEEVVAFRWKSAVQSRRTSADVVALVARLAPEQTDAEIADALNAEGWTTGTGRAFDIEAVRWLRFTHRIRSRPLLAPGELTVEQVATHLGVTANAVYYWIEHGQLAARRTPAGRLCVPFSPEIDGACRQRIAISRHLPKRTQNALQGDVV